jgi:hypothetical protein
MAIKLEIFASDLQISFIVQIFPKCVDEVENLHKSSQGLGRIGMAKMLNPYLRFLLKEGFNSSRFLNLHIGVQLYFG